VEEGGRTEHVQTDNEHEQAANEHLQTENTQPPPASCAEVRMFDWRWFEDGAHHMLAQITSNRLQTVLYGARFGSGVAVLTCSRRMLFGGVCWVGAQQYL
jgi:hypothetical protein